MVVAVIYVFINNLDSTRVLIGLHCVFIAL